MLGKPVRSWLLGIWAVGALVYLFVPIAIVVAFSFNDPQGRYNLTWQGFTLDHWLDPFGVEGLSEALRNSLLVVALAVPLGLLVASLAGWAVRLLPRGDRRRVLLLVGIALLVHTWMGVKGRNWFFMACVNVGCLSAVVGYVGRVMMRENPFNFITFMIQLRKSTNLSVQRNIVSGLTLY